MSKLCFLCAFFVTVLLLPVPGIGQDAAAEGIDGIELSVTITEETKSNSETVASPKLVSLANEPVSITVDRDDTEPFAMQLTPSFARDGIALRGTVTVSGQSQNVSLITREGEAATVVVETAGDTKLRVGITTKDLR